MKIYTKTGDKGETGLFGGQRVRKDHPRIRAYGAIDHLNSLVGVARSLKPEAHTDEVLKKIQNDLFDIGALLATPDESLKLARLRSIGGEDSIFLEQEIDRMEKDLPPLKTFILPGGGLLGAVLHEARTICRAAERDIVALSESTRVDAEVLKYINRLSDYLFVLARWTNSKEGISDVPWEKKK